VRGPGEGVVFLLDVPFERVLKEGGAVLPADFLGAVGGEGIDHHYFVGNAAHRRQATANVTLLVESNHHDGKRNRIWHIFNKTGLNAVIGGYSQTPGIGIYYQRYQRGLCKKSRRMF
jgi:hypothetical protein